MKMPLNKVHYGIFALVSAFLLANFISPRLRTASSVEFRIASPNGDRTLSLQVPRKFLQDKFISEDKRNSVDMVYQSAGKTGQGITQWKEDSGAFEDKRRLELRSLTLPPLIDAAGVASIVFNYSSIGAYQGIRNAGEEMHQFGREYGFWEFSLIPAASNKNDWIECKRLIGAGPFKPHYACDESRIFKPRGSSVIGSDGIKRPMRTPDNSVIFFPKIEEEVVLECAHFSKLGEVRPDKAPCFLHANYKGLLYYKLTFARNHLSDWRQNQKEAEALIATFLTNPAHTYQD